jgi:crotonobetainyl-CoA:carnitine CoA-transferase CaiB-like acyl-CoA transferase
MQEIAAVCDKALIPGTMCSTTKEALQEPQLYERNMIVSVTDVNAGKIEMPGRPIKFVGETEEALRPAPDLGEHNAEIYKALASDSTKLELLQREGVI